jgi:hypothetical protein
MAIIGQEAIQGKAAVIVQEVRVAGNPVAQGRKGLESSVAHLFVEKRCMTMAEDHGIIALPIFFPREEVHDSHQSFRRLPGHLFTHPGTETGHPPEEPQGEQPLQAIHEGASQESPERQVFPVAPVNGIPMGNEHPAAVHFKIRALRIDLDPEPTGKILVKKKIMISLAKANPDPFLLQSRDSLYHVPESGIDCIPSPEPEVEEISCDNEMIYCEHILRHLPAPNTATSPEPVEKTGELFMGGIPWTLQVSIGEEDRPHAGASEGKVSRKRHCAFEKTVLSITAPLSDLPLPFKTGNGKHVSLPFHGVHSASANRCFGLPLPTGNTAAAPENPLTSFPAIR